MITIIGLTPIGVHQLCWAHSYKAKNLSRISAKKVRSSSRKVTGKAQKKTSIIITGGKKTYKGKVAANGKYSVRIAKQKKGTRLRIAARDKNKNEAFTTIKVK